MAEQKQNAARNLPKNIRQIGTSTGSTRVYLEDYVYTYLHVQEEQESWTRRGFMLLGRMEREKEYTRYFISGLIRLEDQYFKDSILEFNDDTWAHIYQEMKKYYDNLEIVGWGQDTSGASAGLAAEIERIHKQNFNIQKNVLFLLDQVEKEEAFYIFEKNMLQRREGYYVYYEKNPQMQEYMIASNKSRELDIPSEEIIEPLVHSYRETLLDKKAQLAARKWNGVLYTTSMLLVLAVCVLGVSTVNNVEKMQNLESTVSRISGQSGGQTAGADVPAMSQNTQLQKEAGRKTDDTDETNDTDKTNGSDKINGPDETNADSNTKNDSSKNDGQDQAAGYPQGADVQEDGQASKDGQSEQGGSGQDAGPGSSGDVETSALSEAQTYLLQGYYVVKKGDSLVGISKKIYGNAKKAKKICDLNGIEDMDKIFVGQKLELP